MTMIIQTGVDIHFIMQIIEWYNSIRIVVQGVVGADNYSLNWDPIYSSLFFLDSSLI